MDTAALQGVLDELGNKVGLGSLTLDAHGVCALAVDGRLVVHLAVDEGEGRAVVYATLGNLPPGEREALLTGMLQANATGWAVLALEPASGQPVLIHRFAVRDVDRSTLELLLEQFIAAAGDWQTALASRAPASAPADAGELHHMMSTGIRI